MTIGQLIYVTICKIKYFDIQHVRFFDEILVDIGAPQSYLWLVEVIKLILTQ